MAEDTPLLNPRQVAEILGVHQKTVHLWLRSGKLQGIKISYRAWRIPQSALDSFIAGNSNTQLKQQPGQPQRNGEESTISLHSRKLKEESKEEHGVRDSSPQSKMKHYIRDIMGEQHHEE
jgi:excisionase family DNA binding protein